MCVVLTIRWSWIFNFRCCKIMTFENYADVSINKIQNSVGRLQKQWLLGPVTHGNVFLRFCIVSSNELVVLDSLENSKQYKNAGKRFRVHGVLRLFFTYVYVRMLNKYALMNEFTCIEHSVRIRRSKKRSTGNQPLVRQCLRYDRE